MKIASTLTYSISILLSLASVPTAATAFHGVATTSRYSSRSRTAVILEVQTNPERSSSSEGTLFQKNDIRQRRRIPPFNTNEMSTSSFTPTKDYHNTIDRREAMLAGTATTVAALLPLLKELLPEMGAFQGPASASSLLSSNLLKGDAIVRSLWLGRLAYPVLIVSLEMGLFEALKDSSLTKRELGLRLTPTLSGRGRVLEALVAVLASLDLLQLRHHRDDASDGNNSDISLIALTDSARTVVLKDSPCYWGPQLLGADGITGALRQAVRRDERGAAIDYESHSAAAVDSFIDSMQAHGSVTALATARALKPIIGKESPNPVSHILDMAGGSGCFATALSSELPGIEVTLADVPAVADRFGRSIAGSNGGIWKKTNRSNINAVAADLFHAETWPTGPDCHLLANVLHDWSEGQVQDIVRASYQTLSKAPPTGSSSNKCLVVVEQLLSDDKTGPLPAALASVSMMLGDWRTGKQYSFPELKAALKAVGFSRVELGPHCGEFHRAVIAYI
jgi:O-methyltransferase domain